MKQVHLDPAQASAIYQAWQQLPKSQAGNLRVKGPALLDGTSLVLLKSEFLAAQAGVVPWVPLPGGGQGVLTVGAAHGQPESAWPSESLLHLYRLTSKAATALHASVQSARIGTPSLEPGTPPSTSDAQQEAAFWSHVGPTSVQMGLAPAAWVVIAAVGILATMAGSWYAARTKETEIEASARLQGDMARLGNLTDLAQAQLAATGKIDDGLVRAIGATGSDAPMSMLPGIAIGAGLTCAAGAGLWYAHKRYR